MEQNGGAQFVNSEFGRYFHFIVLILHRKKHAVYQRHYRNKSFLSIRHVHGDFCNHLEIDSSTDLEGMSVLLMFVNYRLLSARILIGDIYISFTLSRHEPSSGLIASEISNSWKVLLVL